MTLTDVSTTGAEVIIRVNCMLFQEPILTIVLPHVRLIRVESPLSRRQQVVNIGRA